MSDTATLYKSNSAAAESLDDITLLKRIKKHLSSCVCCREAITGCNNNND